MPTEARTKLVDALLEYAEANGIAHASLRDIATGVGTSHRMLIHHFGSKEGVLVAVITEMERRQQAALTTLADGPDLAAPDGLWSVWERWADPDLMPFERLFFELYGQALTGRPWAVRLLDGVVDDWIEPVVAVLRAAGFAGTDDTDARLAIAVTRGLLLDLLATGDRTATDAAMRRFVDRWATG
ncbi:TetR/AcrR family transcriptional regulator [Solicola gregarius]|uniref:TetR/AcrR family transcriptional regulator n=1 Tax=Solicola gregarius TaxID=2908642 RepID=A0AA46YPJ0_9ACTN|nr:TetR/AcrR family transcriptional regulator [Solicola gregarius]UYM07663.1 TetR/AcrR family transcriptional regulator [Solicola gregarius]